MKIAVIGAGPSGMMAAFAAASNHDVTIFEKNEKLGKKLYITGKGRCNLTNYVDASDFFKNVISNKKFVSTILSASRITTASNSSRPKWFMAKFRAFAFELFS